MDTPDLKLLPVLQCWPADGGRFITLPAVHTVDPETGSPNVGMYRMQVFEKNLTGMHWHLHKTGAAHFAKYKAMGKRMPVTVTLGGDPVYTYAATAPMPENMDEYLLAGFLRKRQVRLVKCLTNDLYVPEDVDFVIEGYVDPEEDRVWEGPFGDHTGFYSLADWYPLFHVTCITHRKDAVYPATIVGIPPMEDAWIGKATERIFLSPIRLTMVPELTDMYLPFAGVAHNISIVKIRKTYPGQAVKVMHSLWGAGQMMFNKILVVVDDKAEAKAEAEAEAQGTEQRAQGTGLFKGSKAAPFKALRAFKVVQNGLRKICGHPFHPCHLCAINPQSAIRNFTLSEAEGHESQINSQLSAYSSSKQFEISGEQFIQDSRFKIQDSRSQLPTANCQLPTANCQLPTLNIDIHNYFELTRLFAENFDPDYSLHFSRGPLDILDHSSQKYAFGSKLGIDLTRPFPEEIPSGKPVKPVYPSSPPKIPIVPNVLSVPNVTSCQSLFETLNLPVLLLTLNKDATYSKTEFEKELAGASGTEPFLAVLLFNEGADLNDLFSLVWLLGANMEPGRDISVLHTSAGTKLLLADATFKTGEHDGFCRDWPNVVTMDESTIAVIDRKWTELGLGEFILSPSLKYKALVRGEGAVSGT